MIFSTTYFINYLKCKNMDDIIRIMYIISVATDIGLRNENRD
ncbi:hypothetical protein CLSA_c33910 [Clostridium saccharobutylicum DSM 13864]|uniref:Uncharacterized protein n=1 Tax=Clostridium saccharobutylicum DSM 13864 TaxID=1345695 RepID=U5MU89_CLOSA|nr:hypothetical protein CLSA_c33910 [Clostridium saccharobutylicum DSM 13864]